MLGGWGAPAQPGSGAREKALAAAFPNARVVADRVYLTEEQAEAVREISGGDLPTRIYARYIAFRGKEVVGRAYVDTHIVRTKRESLLISLGADGRLQDIAVTAFLEPPDYLPGDLWLGQFTGRALDAELAPDRAIHGLTGATLTTRAVTAAARRVLALDKVLEADGAGSP